MDEFGKYFGLNYKEAISNEGMIFKGEKYRITVLSELLVRLEYSETGKFEDRPTEFARKRNFNLPKIIKDETETKLTLKTTYFELIYEKEKPFYGQKFSPDQYLKVKLLDTDKVWFFTQAEARNFKSLATSMDDLAKMPHLEKGLYSTDGFVSIDDSKSLIFNEDGSVGKRSDARVDTYLFMYKKDFGYALKDYYKLTGYPPLIPRYALGIWWDKLESYTPDGLLKDINHFRKNEIPLSVIILNNWSKDNITFDTDKIKNPSNLFTEVKARDVHIGLNIKTDNMLVNNQGTLVNIPFNVFDKNLMTDYFFNKMKELTNIGIDFFAPDFRGKDMYSLRMLNYYFYNFTNNLENKRGMILSRNGLVSSHLYPVNTSGETIVSWNLLKTLPEFNSSSSNIGTSYWSHAIGGFKDGIEEADLYTRFVEFGTFSPIFRLSSKEGHYYKRAPWRWDIKTQTIASDYMTLRHKLIPYIYSEAYKYAKTGLPINQPLYYRYPELFDEPTYKNEYYFGTEFFIAPITEPKDDIMNRSVVRLFLPNGMWYDFKTGKKFPGGKRYISFFKDEDYPVFVKQGGIIPLSILKENELNFTGNPEEMEIHIFPGKSNTYKLYEDDGISNEYRQGKFLTTGIDYNYLPNNYTVIIRPLEGDISVIPAKRKYKIRFRNIRQADEVIVYEDAEKIDVTTYLDEQDFILETPLVDTSKQLSINCKGKDIEIDAVRIINEDIDTIISDLKIPTKLKELVASIMFSDADIKKKRIAIRKLGKSGLNTTFIKMFLKLLDYVAQI